MEKYLMHRSHKYLSRKWVNGRWQYEYDFSGSKNPLVRAADKAGVDEIMNMRRNEKQWRRSATRAADASRRRRKLEENGMTRHKAYREAVYQEGANAEAMKRLTTRRKQLSKQYGKTTLGKIQNKANKGRKAVARLISKAAKKTGTKKYLDRASLAYDDWRERQ